MCPKPSLNLSNSKLKKRLLPLKGKGHFYRKKVIEVLVPPEIHELSNTYFGKIMTVLVNQVCL
jgi:hypothetical protein